MSINRDVTQQEKDWLDLAVENELFAPPKLDQGTLQAMAADVESAAPKAHIGCCGVHGSHGCCGRHHHK